MNHDVIYFDNIRGLLFFIRVSFFIFIIFYNIRVKVFVLIFIGHSCTSLFSISSVKILIHSSAVNLRLLVAIFKSLR